MPCLPHLRLPGDYTYHQLRTSRPHSVADDNDDDDGESDGWLGICDGRLNRSDWLAERHISPGKHS